MARFYFNDCVCFDLPTATKNPIGGQFYLRAIQCNLKRDGIKRPMTLKGAFEAADQPNSAGPSSVRGPAKAPARTTQNGSALALHLMRLQCFRIN